MKKRKTIISIMFIIYLIITLTHDNYAAVKIPSKSIVLNTRNLTIYKTQYYTLKKAIYPTNTTDNIKWSSSNNKIVSINQQGKIKANQTGIAKITVNTSSGKKAYCNVKVINICAKSITLNQKALAISKNSTFTLKATTIPAKITESITWTSSNPNIVSVNKGVIKGLSYGSSIITVKTTSGKKYSCKVKVINPKYKHLVNKKLSVIGDSISTYNGYIPSEYKYFYPKGTIDSSTKMWWSKVAREAGMTLLSNCSWSGSKCIGKQSSTSSAKAACSDKRIKDLSKPNETPDIVICYIGINDYIKNAKLSKYSLTENYTTQKAVINNFTYAYSTMINKIKTTYPNTSIYCCTLIPLIKHTNSLGYNVEDYNDVIRKLSNKYNATIVELYECGINPPTSDVYTLDGIHPNPDGMDLIKNAVLAKF